MKYRAVNKNEITATLLATILILSIFTIASSLMQNKMGGIATSAALALQFPKSQQIDLMAINSGKPPITTNFNLIKGYTVQPVLWNLTLPSAMTFDDKGNMYIAEGGYSYGGLQPQPRILKIQQNGNTSILLDRLLNGPVTDITFHTAVLYYHNLPCK